MTKANQPDSILANNSQHQQTLTPAQAADILGLSKGTLEVWRSTGRYNLPFIKMGRYVRYRLSDINAFIESRTYCNTTQARLAGGAV
jgi:excisionase family DNA binding protein